ncbi:unnamed protein product, partial [Effrenium voratum]
STVPATKRKSGDANQACGLCSAAMATATVSFGGLPQEVQEVIRAKQREAQAKKKARKSSERPLASEEARQRSPQRTQISMEEYFSACPAGLFQQRGLLASEENLERLLGLDFNQEVGRFADGSPVRLSSFNYFQFAGTEDQVWDPIFLARLAYEGFFTITTQRFRERIPLPELQPFYGVLDWHNFNRSKHVKKALKRATSSSEGKFHLYSSRNMRLAFERIDRYHKEQHGENWMTWKYLEVFERASADPSVNFRLHSIELYDGPLDGAAVPCLVAAEVGYTIGKVYTSLSGFNQRTEDGVGWIQLSLLGKWLEYKGYSFWSLGHCYSPQMEYKRQMGHRIYPRAEFLARLKSQRGPFRVSEDESFCPLSKGEACDLSAVLHLEPKEVAPRACWAAREPREPSAAGKGYSS